ncbi:hypothetical protein [Capnocytophaga sp.]|uniref:hypothetical protein n=1 Tax=Capnocytophaga sp. TaxID=44737 RepID=UPI0026DC1E31|nr:hypothetical protein [Capnocytophaga sp.]MDO5104638.1 hypothetical protein [Capnocytophaga sp.]
MKRHYKSRKKTKIGIRSFLWIFGTMASILGITIVSFVIMTQTSSEVVKGLQSETYQAEVIDNEIDFVKERYKNADGEIIEIEKLMYIPVVRFVTTQNDTIVKALDFSVKRLQTSYPIKYYQKNDEIIGWGFAFLLKVIASSAFSLVFGSLLIGIFIYIFNGNTQKYLNQLITFGKYVLFPSLLIAAELLLIYAYFNGDTQESGVKTALLASITIIGIVILVLLGVFLRNFFQKRAQTT